VSDRIFKVSQTTDEGRPASKVGAFDNTTPPFYVFHLERLSGIGPLGKVSDLGQKPWPALESAQISENYSKPGGEMTKVQHLADDPLNPLNKQTYQGRGSKDSIDKYYVIIDIIAGLVQSRRIVTTGRPEAAETRPGG
jgi:hypothetical protein